MVESMDTVLVVAPAAVYADAGTPFAGGGMDYLRWDAGMAEGNYKIQTFGLLMVLVSTSYCKLVGLEQLLDDMKD